MKSLFATILAISASTSALPAIANPVSNLSSFNQVSSSTKYLSTLPVKQKADLTNSYTFTQRSLNIAKQIPNDAIGLLMFDIDQRSWQAPNQSQLSGYSPISPINVLDKLLSYLGKTSESAFLKNIQSWLGSEVALTVLLDPTDKRELMFVAMLPVTDDQKFDLFIKNLKSLSPSKPTETVYQNVQILEWHLTDKADDEVKPDMTKPDQAKPEVPKKSSISKTLISRLKHAKPSNSSEQDKKPDTEQNEPSSRGLGFEHVAIAKLPSGVAVIADDRQAIEKMIDLNLANASSEVKLPSFADNQLFLRSLNNPLWNRSLIAGYGDFAGLTQFAEALAEELPETSEIPGFSRAEYMQSLKYSLSQYSSFDLFTWITPKGLRSQSNNYFSEVRSPQPKDMQTRDRLLSYLPANIYGAITSRNLNQQWQWFVSESEQQPTYKIFVEGLRTFLPMIMGTESGIDIEKDFISWMDGEYAFVAFPSDRSAFKSIGIDLTMGMLIRTSKPEVANASLDKLTKYLTNVGKDIVQVKKRQVGATLLTSFEFPDEQEQGKTQSIFAYGWRDHQTLMLTLGSGTASAFIPNPKPSLADSEMFRDAISEMPQPNFGYFYLDANAIGKPVSELILSGVFPSPDDSANQPPNPVLQSVVKTAVDKLGGLVFVYSETSDRFQADFFLGIKP